MASYQCPLCHKQVERDLLIFLDHTQSHVIDEIKKSHPEWVESDGTCQPCADYYRKQISGEFADGNIGPHERKKRLIGAWASALAFLVLAGILFSGPERANARILLFIPLFSAVFCFLQYRRHTCSILAEIGNANLDEGNQK